MEIAYVFGACVVIGTIILIYNLIALKHSGEVRHLHQNETFSNALLALSGNFSCCKHSNCVDDGS